MPKSIRLTWKLVPALLGLALVIFLAWLVVSAVQLRMRIDRELAAEAATSPTPTPTPIVTVHGGTIAVTAGHSLTIAGQNFGALPGRVEFTSVYGYRTLALISAWSDTSIALMVPPDASSGQVTVTREDRQIPLVLTAQASGGRRVDRLNHTLGPGARLGPSGDPIVLVITALDASGRPMPKVPIDWTRGGYYAYGQVRIGITNDQGRLSLSLDRGPYTIATGPLHDQFDFSSGRYTFDIAPLLASSTAPTATIRETITVRDAQGRPVAGVLVGFDDGTTALTDSRGIVATDLHIATELFIHADVPEVGLQVNLDATLEPGS